MTEFEEILQECLQDLERGRSSMDECLNRHPQYARQLEPILLASASLQQAGQARVSEAFKARVRARLIEQMHEHPRRPARSSFPFMRLAVGLAVVLFALLATGTAYAQSALPGDSLYAWKLTSERAWRALSPDPVGTDLAIAARRVEELSAVREDPALYAQTLDAYLEVTSRLRSELGPDEERVARFLSALDAQVEQLTLSGSLPDESDQQAGPAAGEPTSTATATPQPLLQTPEAISTALPSLAPTLELSEPTVQAPAEILPTIQKPPRIVPTIEIPPPIR